MKATGPFTVNGKIVPGQFARHQDGAGLPPARARHVRAAAGLPRRLRQQRQSRRAVRRCGMDAGDADGRAVRSHSRRVDGPFQKIPDFAKVPAGIIKSPSPAPLSSANSPAAKVALSVSAGGSTFEPPQAVAGYYFSHENTHSFVAINRLLAAGEDVVWLATGAARCRHVLRRLEGHDAPDSSKGRCGSRRELSVDDIGSNGHDVAPSQAADRTRGRRGAEHAGRLDAADLQGLRVPYVDGAINGSPNDIYPADINAGNLNARFDVLVFNNVAVGMGGGGRGGWRRRQRGR